MPRGDYRKHEAKKPKKDKRKTLSPASLVAPPEPERVRRERKLRHEEAE